MTEYLEVLRRVPLFRGMADEDIAAALECLGGRTQTYRRGEAVLRAGDPAQWLGVVVSGSVQVSREGADGNRTLMAAIPAGGMFAEAYACAGAQALPVSVWAGEDCAVLLLDCRRAVGACPAPCAFHAQLVANLLGVLAEKNIFLSRKIEHLSKRTLAEKLLSYLEEQAALAGSDSFVIPLDRQALADYLCADRSALSREIGRLRREGRLNCQRNRFTLL